MHLHQLLFTLAILASLVYSYINGPTEPDNTIDVPTTSQDQLQPEPVPMPGFDPEDVENQPESLHLQLRGVTKQLDYKCGPKYGTCPSGTCCSSAGM